MSENSKHIKYSVLMSLYYKESPEFFSKSINSMLNQTVKPNEIVIVKDGPLTPELDDKLKYYVNEYKNIIKIVPLDKNVGLGLALAQGVKSCINDLIVRMDTDDISIPQRCEMQLKYLEEHKDIGMVGCVIDEFIDEISNVVARRNLPENHNEIVAFSKKRVPIAHPSIVYRKSDVIACGNYRHRHLVEDYDIIVRLLKYGVKSYNIQTPLVYMRVNSDFYMRRGGWKFLKSLLSFNYELYKIIKWTSLYDFIVRSLSNIIICLMPNKIRNAVYKLVLRKQVKQ